MVDLLDWDAPAKPATPAGAGSASSLEADFGGFVSASGPAPVAPAPTVDKNSILSLFNTPMAPAHGMYPGYVYSISALPFFILSCALIYS